MSELVTRLLRRWLGAGQGHYDHIDFHDPNSPALHRTWGQRRWDPTDPHGVRPRWTPEDDG